MNNSEQAGEMLRNRRGWSSEQDTKAAKSDWRSIMRHIPHFVSVIGCQYKTNMEDAQISGNALTQLSRKEISINMLQKLTDLVVSTYEIDIFRRRSIRIRTIYQNAQPAPQNRSSLSDTATGSLLKIINIAQLLPTDTSGLSPMY